MEDERKRDMNPESHAGEDSKKELDEKEQENPPIHVTSEKTEVIGRNKSDTSDSRRKDPEALESVHKYASRIKSFLGWDSNDEESELVKDLDELINVADYADVPPKLDQNIDENNKLKTMNENNVKSDEVCNNSEKDKSNPENDEEFKKDDESPNKTGEVGKSYEDNENMRSHDEISTPESLSSGTNENSDKKDIKTPGKSNQVENIQDTEYLTVEDSPNGINCNPAEDELSGITSENFALNFAEIEKNNAETEILPENEGTVEKKDEDTSSRNSCANDLLIKSTDESGNEISRVTPKGDLLDSDINDKDTNLSDTERNDNVQDLEYRDENIASRKNVMNPHLEDIRRLSMDIVKDVIDSARSSVHEIFLNKNERVKDGNLLEDDEAAKNNLGSCKLEFLKEKDVDTVDPHRNAKEYSNADTQHVESKNLASDFTSSFDSRFYEKETNGNNFEEYKELLSEKKEPEKDVESLIDPDTICGLGCFKPKCIQKWATPKSFLVFFSLLGVIHGTYYSYFVAMISTLEKRYAFTSKISGTLLLADEITPLLFGILVGYIGGKTHRPRMTALGMFMAVACCFITAFPYFIYGSATHLKIQNSENHTSIDYCYSETKKSSCSEEDKPPTMSVVILLLIASLLKGFATLSYYIMGVSYMDDNTSKKSTPLYLAIALALRLLGPLLGYLMSFVFLKMYENPFEDPGFGTDDPRWIGAWWLGFCVQGVLLLIFSIPIALFPRRMPGQKKPDQVTSATNKETMREMFSGLFAAIKRLAKNPVFIFLAINTVLTIFGHFGHLIMLPKYMENQFRLSASDASLYSGVTSVSCIMLSTVLGGYLVWKFKPTAKMLLGGIVGSEIILVLGYLVLTIPKCQMIEMSNFGTTNEGLILNSLCNENCDCSTTSFTPFCGSDGKTTYFSPCHAGCTQQLNTTMLPHKHKNFGNCSCVADEIGMIGGQVTEGFCPDENCWNQAIAYLIILLILLTICNTFAVCHTIILLRSVHPNDKSFALGTFETFICLCGFIPAPVTYGALVDSACLVWEKSCGQTGNCWFYDMGRYNYSIHIASSVFCGLSTMCLITLYCLSSRIRNLYVDEEDEQDYVNVKLDTVSGSVTKL